MWWLVFPALAAAYIAVIIIRALLFRPHDAAMPECEPVYIDGEGAAERFRQLLRCRTISHEDASLDDEAEFERFHQLIKELYPNAAKAMTVEYVGGGVLMRLAGDTAAEPSVFMAHFDVVPCDDSAWKHPPFEAYIDDDGIIWARGAIDTKLTLCGVMEALEKLTGDGFKPKHDIYAAFGCNEETSGESAKAMVHMLEERGIVPGLVIDEGGAVADGVFPGYNGAVALIGTQEKGTVDVDICAMSMGGHSSTPPPETNVTMLARAIRDINAHPAPVRLTPTVKSMFDCVGRRASLGYRVIFANLWCFLPLLGALGRQTGGDINAMLRTTVCFTRMSGSSAYNVIPPKATVGANIRTLGESAQTAVDRMRKRLPDDVSISIVKRQECSVCSDTDGEAYRAITETVRETWPEAVTAPYLMTAGSDSSHYCRITDKVYRFTPLHITDGMRSGIHGHDEHVPAAAVAKCAEFYVRLMQKR